MRPFALALGAFLILLGIAGRMDYDDNKADQAHYCEMVREGAWPAYRGECDES